MAKVYCTGLAGLRVARYDPPGTPEENKIPGKKGPPERAEIERLPNTKKIAKFKIGMGTGRRTSETIKNKIP